MKAAQNISDLHGIIPTLGEKRAEGLPRKSSTRIVDSMGERW